MATRAMCAGLVLGLSLLGACGGDDDAADSTPSTSATATPTATVTATETSSPTSTSTSTPTPTVEATATAVIDFEHAGNLVRDNPGLPPNKWFLVYEQAGAPALTVQLDFDEASVCVADAVPISCDTLEPGTRVAIQGTQLDEASVRVVRLGVTAAP